MMEDQFPIFITVIEAGVFRPDTGIDDADDDAFVSVFDTTQQSPQSAGCFSYRELMRFTTR